MNLNSRSPFIPRSGQDFLLDNQYMTLDVILPTYNRAILLATALDSLIAATCPEELGVTVFVVDNNSKDNTAEVVRAYQEQVSFLRYIFEAQQGSSAALNAGIRAGTGELVAMINDDEEVDIHWFEIIHELFQNTSFDFAGGPYQPRWSAENQTGLAKNSAGYSGGWTAAIRHSSTAQRSRACSWAATP
jgi:glycosyltransferase involved in cell wall biosynthesis